jgi:hypothetical protein
MPLYEIYKRDGTPVQVEGPEGATTRQLIGLYLEQQEGAEEQSLAERRAARDEALRREYQEILRNEPVTFGQQLQEVPKGILGGAANLFEQGALGIATLFPEESELAVREKIQDVGDAVQGYLAPDVNVQARIEEGKGAAIPRKFSEALGSFGGILGTALIPGVGLPAAASLATAAGAGEASERARAAGASQEDRNLAALKGAGVGITELIPFAGPVGRILRRVPDEVRTGFANRAIDLGIATTAEGAQEALAATLQNMIEQGYNPEQVISEGVAEAGAYGAGVGFTVETLLRFFPRRRGGATDPAEEKDATDEILAIGQEKPVALLPAPPKGLPAPPKGLPAPSGLPVTPEGQAVTPAQEPELEAQRADREATLADMPSAEVLGARTDLAEQAEPEAKPKAEPKPDPIATAATTDTAIGEQLSRALAEKEKAEQEITKQKTTLTDKQLRDLQDDEAAAAQSLDDAFSAKSVPVREEVQQSLPGLKPTYAEKKRIRDRTIPDTTEPVTSGPQLREELIATTAGRDPNIVTDGLLDRLGVSAKAPIRKRIVGKNITTEETDKDTGRVVFPIRQELAKFGNNKNVSKETKSNISRYLANVDEAQGDLFDAKSDPKRGRTSPKDDPQTGGGTTTGTGRGPTGTAKTTSDRVDGTKPDARRGDVGKGGQDATLNKTSLRKLITERVDLKKAQDKRKELLDNPKKMEALAKEKGLSLKGSIFPKMKKRIKEEYDKDQARLEQLDNYFSSKEGKARLKDTKKTKPTTEFKPISSVVPQAASNILFISEKDVPADAPKDDATGLPIVDVKKLQDKKKKTKVTKKETTDANTRAKEVFEKNVTEKNYGYTEELRKFNEKVGDTEVLYDDLPVGDKDKIVDLLESKPQRTKKEGGKQVKQLSYYVAQTLGKSPNIERSLDIAAWEVVNGPNSYKKTEKGEEVLSAGEVAFLATDGNQGKLAGTRVEQWVKQNLSPEGQKWFADRVAFYRAEVSAFNTRERQREKRQEAQRKYQEAIDKQVEDEIKAEGFNSRQAMRELETYYREGGSKSSKLPLFLRTDATANLDVPLHPMITSILGEGNLKSALNVLTSGTENNRVSAVARALSKNMGNTKVVLVNDLTDADGAQVSGQFDPRTNTISINSSRPINTHVLLHEATHALTSATLANKSHPVTKQLTTLFNNVKDKLGDEYGTISLDEFVAETFSNPIFQRKLSTIHVNRQPASAFQRFMNTVSNMLRRLVGLNPKQADALSTANELIEGILAPSPEFRDANQLYLDTSIPSKAAAALNNMASDSATYIKGNNFYNYIQDGRGWLGSKIPLIVKKAWLSLQPVNILAELSESRVPGAGQLNTIINNMSSALRKRNESLDPIVRDLKEFRKSSPEAYTILQSLIPNATYERIDPREDKFENAYGHKKGSDRYNPEEGKQIHAELRRQYAQLGKRGRDMYKVITNTFETSLADVMDAVEANLAVTIANAEGQKRVKDKLAELLNQERGTIKPFAPLTRGGRHRLKYTALDPKTNNVEVYVEYFKTVGDREKAKIKLQEYNQNSLGRLPAGDPRIAQIKSAQMEEGTNTSTIDYRNAPKGSFVYRVFEILEKEGADKATINKVVDLALDSMPERSFIQSFRERKDVRGFLGDVTPTGIAGEAFDLVDMVETKGRDYNRQLVQMEYGAKIQKFQREVLEEPLPAETTDATTTLYKDRLNRIANFAKSPDIPRWSQSLTAAGYAWTMGWNISSAAITTFDVIMSSAPRMAGRYGDIATTRAIGRATAILAKSPKTKMVKVMGPDGKMTNREVNTGIAGFSIGNYDYEKLKGMSDKDIQEAGMTKEQHQNLLDLETLSEVAKDNAQINQSLNQEELDMNNAGDALEKVNSFTSFLFHHAERYNREVAMTSNYMLELQRLRNKPTKEEASLSDVQKQERAAFMAIKETEFTLGATASAGRPIAAQSAIGNVAMLFKRFAMSKYHMMATMTNDAFQAGGDATTRENRRIAQHQLARFLITTGILTGVAGMPLMGALGEIYDLFSDDEDDDFDAMMRKTVGEGFYKGIINTALGAEVSSRISMNSLLYRPPIIEKDQSKLWTMIEQLGGPVVGIGLSVERGMGLVADGEVMKGVQAITPAAVRNIIKGIDQGITGEVTTRRGDAVVEDISFMQAFLQGVGFTNADLVAQYDYNRNELRKRNALGGDRSKLLRNFNIAITEELVNGNVAALQEALEAIQKYNNKLSPMETTKYIVLPKTLERSLESFQRRTTETIGGIVYDPIMRLSLEEYDRGMRLFS